MSAAILTPFLIAFSGLAWLSFIVLARAAIRKPRIGALTERAVLAFLLAVLGTVSSFLAANRDTGHALFTTIVAGWIFGVTVIVVVAVPTFWLLLWALGRLGEAE